MCKDHREAARDVGKVGEDGREGKEQRGGGKGEGCIETEEGGRLTIRKGEWCIGKGRKVSGVGGYHRTGVVEKRGNGRRIGGRKLCGLRRKEGRKEGIIGRKGSAVKEGRR